MLKLSSSDSDSLFTKLTARRVINPDVVILHTSMCNQEMRELHRYILFTVGKRKTGIVTVEIFRILGMQETLLGIRFLIQWYYSPGKYCNVWVGSEHSLVAKLFSFTCVTPLKRRTFLLHPLVGLIRWSLLPFYTLPQLASVSSEIVAFPPYKSLSKTKKKAKHDHQWTLIQKSVHELNVQLRHYPHFQEAVEIVADQIGSNCLKEK